jgi:hypothetical protein
MLLKKPVKPFEVDRQATPLGSSGRFNAILPLLGLCALMFDYRSLDEGGNVYIYITSALASILFLMSICSQLPRVLGSKLLLGWIVFLPISLGVAIINGVDFVSYGRSSLAIYLFVLSLCAGYSSAWSGLKFDALFLSIAAIGVINGLWKWHYSTSVASVDVYEMRYQILSATVVFFLAIFVSKFIFSKKIPWFYSICAIPVFGAIAVSITRSLIFVGVVLLLFSLIWYLCVERKRQASIGVLIIARQLSIISAIVGFVIIPLVVYLRPNTFEAWTYRFNEVFSGPGVIDETAGVRGAQMLGMIKALGLNPLNWSVGKGFGSTYGIDIEFISRLSSLDLTAKQMDSMLYRGLTADTTWVSLVFVGGMFLLILFVLVLYKIWLYVRVFKYVSGVEGQNARDLIFILLAILGVSFTSNLLLDRLGSSILGVIAGLAMGSLMKLAESNSFQRERL